MRSTTMKKTLMYFSASLVCTALAAPLAYAQTAPAYANSPGCAMGQQDKNSMVMMNHTNLRNVSWGEVILWCGNGDTYNTMGLNEPKDSMPLALYQGLDKAKLAKQLDVPSVSLNPDSGRRFWTCDEFEIETSPTVREFNGLKTRYVGFLPAKADGSPQDLSPAAIPKYMYKPLEFKRSSVLVFKKDRPVFLLTDPQGISWVIKTYQTGVDPTLNFEALSTIDKRYKHLPEGWKFRTLTLDKDLVLTAKGSQRIMWDEFGGSWDALDPGTVNYVP
ncbi:hypothetical protein SAMN05216296_2112 [Pseudomonas pohangensis]|uniref:Uncharacterized protein n=1 Tax=Pseudomonas pohangensis TaxID=364197 RepID=A0A1H2G8N3_9PSED|nr:hypothetical protein [Pseudomonas pohangensis]SDU15728.1 hypothetical protein SAMN05216296_2112 [Pseudomonas pohangensis]